MKRIGSAVFGIVGVLAFTATGASAAIVCNELGDCWHVNEKYDYKPEFNLHVYSDDWAFPEGGKYRWREHAGRGYWGPNGVWIEFWPTLFHSKERPLRLAAVSTSCTHVNAC